MGKTISVESIDEYNKMLGIETYHPLVTVCNLKDVPPKLYRNKNHLSKRFLS